MPLGSQTISALGPLASISHMDSGKHTTCHTLLGSPLETLIVSRIYPARANNLAFDSQQGLPSNNTYSHLSQPSSSISFTSKV